MVLLDVFGVFPECGLGFSTFSLYWKRFLFEFCWKMMKSMGLGGPWRGVAVQCAAGLSSKAQRDEGMKG